MTTDKIVIKEDDGPSATKADRMAQGGVEDQGADNRQPLQPQQRTEVDTGVPATPTGNEGGLPEGYKGKSPGNGG